MEDFLKDIRFGLRTLLKDKTLAVVAILALAIGTGANTAIFSVINAVLIRPLPYKEPERLVRIWGTNKINGSTRNAISVKNFEDYRKQNTAFDGMASYSYDDFNISKDQIPERVQGSLVSANFFSVLGVTPALGGDFSPAADQPGAERVVVISDGLWKRRFSADKNIIGNDLLINGESFRLIGVAPAGLQTPDHDDPNDEVWIPMSFDGSDQLRIPSYVSPKILQDEFRSRKVNFLNLIGRLKPRVNMDGAQADLEALSGRLEQDYQQANKGRTANIVSVHQEMVGDTKPAMFVLVVAVGFVLLIACANVANLLLARAAARQKEIAIRMALGAGRPRLIRQLLTESIMLGLAGGILGLLLAFGGIKLLVALNPPNIPRLGEVGIDGLALIFTLTISILTGIIFGLVPALQASKPNLNEALKEGGKGTSASGARQRVRSLIVISEVALTLILLIGAALMLKSFVSLQNVDPGFSPENVLTMQMTLPTVKYSGPDEILSFYEQSLTEIQNTQGVLSAGIITNLPLGTSRIELPFTVEGRPQSPEERFVANVNTVSENYFSTMGIARVNGRLFSEQDNAESDPVIIVNKSLAERFWPGESPIDKRLIVPDFGEDPLRVIGVVTDVKHSKLSDTTPGAEIYFPYRQNPERYMALVVRTSGDPEAMTKAVSGAVQKVDPYQPVYSVKTMQTLVSESISQPRLYMALLSIFAAVALALAAIGIYGVMSYLVTQRTHEIGIRMALGAGARDIMKMVVGQGMMLAFVGTAIGLAVAIVFGLIASRAWPELMTGLLFGVGAIDLTTYLLIPALLVAVALFSVFIPALRATKVDPMIALRYE